jgi:hypothetical protein
MEQQEKEKILKKFEEWFSDSLIASHKKNTEKLSDIKEFNINPFLLHYLANFLEGNSKPSSMAKALLYPRALGTSITTSFGSHMQTFVTKVLGAYGSTTPGIDIEFKDSVDKRKKYCQLKSGPNAINNDDITTIKNHFAYIRNLARQNRLNIKIVDIVFCLIYGEPEEKNSFIQKLEEEYTVYIGREFWYRFTGDQNFYKELILTAGKIAKDVNMKSIVEDVIAKLSHQIESRFKDLLS